MSIQRIDAPREVVGFYQIANLAAAVLIPGNVVEVQAEDGDIRYRLDGGVPTATVGSVIPDGETRRILVGDNELRLISGDGASANIHRFR
jgi:hypothetical protein